jgi:hypothetical protein
MKTSLELSDKSLETHKCNESEDNDDAKENKHAIPVAQLVINEFHRLVSYTMGVILELVPHRCLSTILDW